MNNKMRYTMQSNDTGILFTFCDLPERLAPELKRMTALNFTLVGIEGINHYVCPRQNEFAHDSQGN